MTVYHSADVSSEAEAIDMSGDVGCPLAGSRVGVSSFRQA